MASIINKRARSPVQSESLTLQESPCKKVKINLVVSDLASSVLTQPSSPSSASSLSKIVFPDEDEKELALCKVSPDLSAERLADLLKEKEIFFDAEGVLIDTCKLHLEAWKKALIDIFPDFAIPSSDDWFVFDQSPDDTLRNLGIPGLGAQQFERFRELRRKHYLTLIQQAPSEQIAISSQCKLLKKLKADGRRVAIVSNVGRDLLINLLNRVGIEESDLSILVSTADPEIVPSSSSGRVSKRDAYRHAMQKLGITHPDKCLVFEDSNSGANAALDAGMCVVGIPYKHTSIKKVTNPASFFGSATEDVISAVSVQSLTCPECD